MMTKLGNLLLFRNKLNHCKYNFRSFSTTTNELQSSENNTIKSSSKMANFTKVCAKMITNKSVASWAQLNYFVRGPLQSSLLISSELVKLVAAEQKLWPTLADWPLAKSAYTNFFFTCKSALLEGGRIRPRLDEITWGQAGRAGRIVVEMVAFYYIGQVAGMVLYLPFK